jgi:hypothetical protein
MATGDVHFAGDVIADADQARINVFAKLDDLAAELMADDDRLIAGDIAAVIGQHLVAHPLSRSDLIDALVGAADGGGFDANLDVAVADARLGRIADVLQPIFGE